MLKWIVAALVVLPLLGGVAVASAAPVRDAIAESDRARPRETDRPERDHVRDGATDHARVAGLVVGEQGQTFELRTHGGPVIVHWTADTDCALEGSPVDCDAIEPGHGLVAAGAFAGDSNQFHAKIIRARTADRPSLERIAGEVVHDGDGELGVRTRDGEIVVLYGDGTTCRDREGEIRCEAIEVGDRIVAAGELEGSTLSARLIVLLPDDVDREHARVHGVVTAAHERLLQVETRDGTWSVKFDSETRCSLRDGTVIDCGSIEARARIFAAGVVSDDHTLQAKRIVVLPTADVATDVRSDRAEAS